MRDAGNLPIKTVVEPVTNGFGIGPHTKISEMREAGMPPTIPVAKPVAIVPPPCSGQTCASETRAPTETQRSTVSYSNDYIFHDAGCFAMLQVGWSVGLGSPSENEVRPHRQNPNPPHNRRFVQSTDRRPAKTATHPNDHLPIAHQIPILHPDYRSNDQPKAVLKLYRCHARQRGFEGTCDKNYERLTRSAGRCRTF